LNIPDTAIEHFYDTSNLKDFLFESALGLDLLLLDVHFNGGETGIEALPKIREYSPGLPIILLTGEKNPKIANRRKKPKDHRTCLPLQD
jgi:CheY-like chemotaxis protein